MPTNFAAAQARVNQAVFKHLANAQATLNGVDVVGIFSNLPSTAFEMVDGNSPTFTLPTADVDSDPREQPLVIAPGVHPGLPAGGTYTVANFNHDGTGVTTLILGS
jgi:hypothetical protein